VTAVSRQSDQPILKRWQKHRQPWQRIGPTTVRRSAQLAWLAGTIETTLQRAWDIIADQPPIEIVLRFAPAVASRVLEATWHPSQQVERSPDGSLLWRATVAGTIEIRLWILQWGADVEVLEPPELRADVAGTLERAIATYRD